METKDQEVTEIEELELLGGKRYRCIYACLERANLSELDVPLPALIQEIDALSRASYLYLNQSIRNHFSKSMPYQLLNQLFIHYLYQGGPLRLQKGAGRDCARLRRKLQRRSWKQLNLSSFAALKLHLYL